jgi:hypothetical protein
MKVFNVFLKTPLEGILVSSMASFSDESEAQAHALELANGMPEGCEIIMKSSLVIS